MERGAFVLALMYGLLFSTASYAFKFGEDKPDQLTLSYTKPWLPYIYKDNQGQIAGVDGTLLSRVLDKVGYQLIAFPIPENRLKNIITDGDIDVAIAAFRNPGREKLNWFSIPYRKEKVGFAYLSERSDEFENLDIFQIVQSNFSIGLNNGAWYGEKFEQRVKTEHKYQCFHIEGASRRLKMLSLGRIDIVVGDLQALRANAKELGIENISISEHIIFQDDIHFMFSKKRVDQEFMHKFNKALVQLRQANNELAKD